MRRGILWIILIMAIVFTAAGLLAVKKTGNASQNKFSASSTASDKASSSSASSQVPSPTASATEAPTPTAVPEKLDVVAVGDIMLGRRVGKLLTSSGKGYEYGFKQVEPVLKKGDVIFGNLESPATASEKSLSREHKIILKCSPQAITAVKAAGFNVLSIANNHMMDYYGKGMLDTIDVLNKNGIAFSGGGKNLEEARKPAIIEKNGLKYGVLSYTDMAEYMYVGNPNISYAAGNNKSGVAPRKLEMILEDIARVKPQVDILAVSLHWGVEESFTIPDSQVEFAHKLIDSGADVILGHHPHQFQGIEVYKGKPIIYSMGNFLFDQNDPENQESFIMNMQYSGTQLTSLTATPVRILEKQQVAVQSGKAAAAMLEREASLSGKLGSECRIQDDKLVFTIK